MDLGRVQEVLTVAMEDGIKDPEIIGGQVFGGSFLSHLTFVSPGTPPRPLMGSNWGPNGGGGNSQGGWSSPGMGRGHHGGPRPHSPHGFGGYGGPGPSNDLPSRGRSLLGAPPPLMGEPPGPPHPPSPSHAPVPPPAQGPNVNHLELQAAEIRQNIKTLQVKKSLSDHHVSFGSL